MASATPTMSMNKTIHCAVRRDLARFRTAVASYSEGDHDRAEALHRAWDNFYAQLTEHHEGEHEIAWPALQAIGIDASTIAAFDAEHEQLAADLASTDQAMARLLRSASRDDADAAASALERLQNTAVTHLDHEEEVTEPAFASNAGHPALQEMGKKFSRRAGPAKAGTFFAWMEDGATPEERAALAASVPKPVLTIFGGLFGRRYRSQIAPVWRS